MGHGGEIKGPKDKAGKYTKAEPFVFHGKQGGNPGEVAGEAWQTVGNKCNILPSSLIFTCTKISQSSNTLKSSCISFQTSSLPLMSS
jgi:hypothetical protein